MHAMMQSLISAESEGTVQKASLGKIATSNFDIELPVSHVPNHYQIREETINHLKSKKGKQPAERDFSNNPHPRRRSFHRTAGSPSQVEQVGCEVRASEINVMAPLRAQKVPLLLAPEFTAMEVYAKIFPCIFDPAPIVAEDPTMK
jgi:hypothetical protein